MTTGGHYFPTTKHQSSLGVFKNTSLSLEYHRDSDYSENDGGTGDNSDSYVAQLAVEF